MALCPEVPIARPRLQSHPVGGQSHTTWPAAPRTRPPHLRQGFHVAAAGPPLGVLRRYTTAASLGARSLAAEVRAGGPWLELTLNSWWGSLAKVSLPSRELRYRWAGSLGQPSSAQRPVSTPGGFDLGLPTPQAASRLCGREERRGVLRARA